MSVQNHRNVSTRRDGVPFNRDIHLPEAWKTVDSVSRQDQECSKVSPFVGQNRCQTRFNAVFFTIKHPSPPGRTIYSFIVCRISKEPTVSSDRPNKQHRGSTAGESNAVETHYGAGELDAYSGLDEYGGEGYADDDCEEESRSYKNHHVPYCRRVTYPNKYYR